MRTLLAVMVMMGTAAASPEAKIKQLVSDMHDDKSGYRVPQLAVVLDEGEVSEGLGAMVMADFRLAIKTTKIAVAGDGKAAWVGIDGSWDTRGEAHVTMVVEATGDGWVPVAVDVAVVGKPRTARAKIEQKVDGADEVVKLFTASIADPKALAASVSTRKDVMLYGSDPGEKYAGKDMKAKLASWKLGFKVRGGVRAGVTTSGSVAWVVADLEPTTGSGDYLAMFVYERSGEKWALVQASFSP